MWSREKKHNTRREPTSLSRFTLIKESFLGGKFNWRNPICSFCGARARVYGYIHGGDEQRPERAAKKSVMPEKTVTCAQKCFFVRHTAAAALYDFNLPRWSDVREVMNEFYIIWIYKCVLKYKTSITVAYNVAVGKMYI